MPTETRHHQGYADTYEILARYVDLAREVAATPIDDRQRIEDPEGAYAMLAPLVANSPKETALVVTLDTKHRPLAIRMETVGSLDHTFMSPRELFRAALLDNAASVFLAHNHPSGSPEPSTDDERITRRLVEAGRILGIEVLDHLVIGAPGQWTSLARRGIV
jgi:DNA repair protein RadC